MSSRAFSLLLLLAACEPHSIADVAESPSAPPPLDLTAASVDRARADTAACATMRPLDGDDVVALDGDRLYYLSGAHGVVAFDVSDAAEPRFVARAPVLGLPVSLVVRDGVAIAVMSQWEDPSGKFTGSLLRALDVRAAVPRALADVKLRGTVREARAIGDVLFVLREVDARVVLSSFALPSLEARDERTFEGSGGAITASLTRLALAYRTSDVTTALVVVDWGADVTGDLSPRRAIALRGALPEGAGDFGASSAIALDERTVRVLTCASAACGATEPLRASTIALDAPSGPKVVAELSLPPALGPLVARFDASHLFVGQSRRGADAFGPTLLRVVDFADPTRPRDAGVVRVGSEIANVVIWSDRVMTLGTLTTATSGMSLVMREIDPRQLRVTGSVVLGDATTLTPAQHDVRVVASTPAQDLLALPIAAWDDAARRESNYVAFVRSVNGRLSSARLRVPGWVDRIVPIHDRFVALGEFGVRSLDVHAIEPERARNVPQQ